MHEVFISYSSKDSVIANAVCHILEESDIRCFIAPRDIAPGSIWAESLVSAIRQSRIFVLVFSQNSNQSKQVYKEISIAVDAGLIVIPFITSADKPQGVLEYYITDTHWIDAMTPPLENHIHRLAERVSILLREDSDIKIKESVMEKTQNAAVNMPAENDGKVQNVAVNIPAENDGKAQNASINMPAEKDDKSQHPDQSIQASAEYCPKCGFRHDLHHCPVCGSVRTDGYHTIKRGKVWILLSSFAWLILIAYSVIVAGTSLILLKDDYVFTRWEYAALFLVFAAIVIFCFFIFELVSRAVIMRKRIKRGEKEITARLKKKNIPLYQIGFFTGITIIVSQLVLVIGYYLTI